MAKETSMEDQAGDSLMSPADVARGRELLLRVKEGLSQVILGQEELIGLAVIGLAARGHILLEGLPGLGKTELVKAMGNLLGLSFNRVQFTPDLLPSDITGGPVLQEEEGRRVFVFQPGPLFANLVLADEINRASPKTQSALLEAMQERRVTVMGETHVLPQPFFVLATQNPIELEGTYPLPEAQLDRFLFKVTVPSVGEDVMAKILKERRHGTPPELVGRMSHAELEETFRFVDDVFLPEPVARYIARLTAASHADAEGCPEAVQNYVKHGASPRAAISMAEAARASALLKGRPNVDFTDVERIAEPALAHRLVLQHTARLEGVTPATVVEELLEHVDPLSKSMPKEMA